MLNEAKCVEAEAIPGKSKHLLIARFLSNISSKNCQNRSMYVKVIARQSSDIFETPVHTQYRDYSQAATVCTTLE